MRFRNKVVLVTGASRNTGVGIAALFLREGGRQRVHLRLDARQHGAGWPVGARSGERDLSSEDFMALFVDGKTFARYTMSRPSA